MSHPARPYVSLLVVLVAIFVTAALAAACIRRGPGANVPAPRPAPRVVEGTLAVTNVTVIDVVAGVARPNQTVIANGDRIVALAPAADVRATDGAALVDGTGKYLIPGLWDMHVHLSQPTVLDLFPKFGVTGVRHMFAPSPLYSYKPPADPTRGPVHPRVVAANNVLDGDPPLNEGILARNVVRAKDAESARAAVRELKKKGNDFVKVYPKLSRAAYFAAVEEAKKLGLDVVGHVPDTVSVAEASAVGQRSVEHLDGVYLACSEIEARLRALLSIKAAPGWVPGWQVQVQALDTLDEKKLDALVATFRKHGTWHVPTLVQTYQIARLTDREAVPAEVESGLPDLIKMFWKREYLSDGTVKLPYFSITHTHTDLRARQRLYEGDRKLVARLHTAGVGLLAGTDTPAPLVAPGYALHDELALLVEAGLTPAEALRTATRNPAVFLRREKELGSVEEGKCADLVLLSGNPLSDIRNTRKIESVWIGGRKAVR